MYRMKVCACLILFFSLGTAQLDYRDALEKSILFFEGQRSGKLPPNQRLSWRGNSGLQDGSLAKVDLSGGYYDAGDNVKFNFPMAYTTTMLSWNTLEYGKRMGSQLQNARAAIRWATDYFLKCANAAPNKLFVGVGDPNADHKCWERPEDMDTVRSVYYVSPSNPGSDVAGEMAAALAAASLVFRSVDPVYSKKLLGNAVKVFRFAVQYRGSYSDSLGSAACPFYCSYSGYKDELYWGAAWLLRATNDISYLNLINTLGANDVPDLFSWDNKYAGAHVLMSRGIYALVLDGRGSNVQKYNEEYLHIIYDNSERSVVGNDNRFDSFKQHAEDFVCKVLPNSPYTSTQYTKGGLLYKLPEENLQYVTSITSLLTTYAKYMATKKHTFNCGSLVVTEKTIRSVAKRQVDYILGNNPMKMSYMVGYGHNYPRRIHHRGSSLPSLAMHPQSFGCEAGFQPFYYTANPNPNILVGAIIGGPNQNDFFPDERTDYSHSEPATYINAAIVGPLAYFDSSKR